MVISILILLGVLCVLIPIDFVSHSLYFVLGVAQLLFLMWSIKRDNLPIFPYYLTVIGLAFVITYYGYDYLVEYHFLEANPVVELRLKIYESVGLIMIGGFVLYLTWQYSDFGEVIIDWSAIIFAVMTITFMANWNTVQEFINELDPITQLTVLNIVILIFLFFVYLIEPFLEGFEDTSTSLTIAAIIISIIHYSANYMIALDYQNVSPIILERLARAFFSFAGVCILQVFSYFPLRYPDSEFHTKLKEFSTPFSIITPFAATISLLAVPIFSLYIYNNQPDISIQYIIAIQLATSALFLIRFGFLIKNLLGKTSELRYAAYHDQLTGVLNRRGLKRAYKNLQTQKNVNERFYIAYIDINEFTAINNLYGHSAGDFALKKLAISLERLHEQKIVARLGGDEFVVVFNHFDSPSYSADQLRNELNQWVEYGNNSIYLSVSVGLNQASDGSLDNALENADIAMYSAKVNKNTEIKYNGATTLKPYRQHIKELLQQVIEKQNPSIYIQPIYSLRTYEIVAVEVLTRLEDHRGNIVMPDAFLPVARDNNQLEAFDYLVVKRLNQIIDKIHCQVQINLSSEIINDYASAKRYFEFIKKIGLQLDKVIFEITEKQHIDNANLEHSIRYLHQNGFRFALDDFGTGYSSLERINYFPIQIIKLDGKLLHAARRSNAAAVHAAVSLAHHLGATTTFECIESAEDLKLCQQLGGESVQGFYLCPPIKLEVFIKKFNDIKRFVVSPMDGSTNVIERQPIVH